MTSKKYWISTWLAEFSNRDVETDFQNHMRPVIIRQLKVVLIVWASLLSLFAVPDLIVIGIERPFFYLLTFRVIFVALILKLFFSITPETLVSSVRWPVTILLLAYTTGFMMFFIYRSDSVDLVMGVVALQMLGMLMYVPVRFKFIFWTGLYTIGITLLTRYATGTPPVRLIAMSVFLMLPMVVGAVSAMRLAIWQRRQFTFLRKSQEINKELEQALSDVKELSGLLPICSSCKNIRNDDGYWEQIEGYLKKHSKAEFSHGLCPECMEKLYGDQEWFNKIK